jgi:site-specific recombinase XerD
MKIADEKLFKTIRNFLEIYIPKQRHFSPNTQKSYREALNLFLMFVQEEHQLPLWSVAFLHFNSGNLNKFMRWLETSRKCSPATVNHRLMAIKSFAKYCSITDPSRLAFQLDISNVQPQKAKSRTVEFISENGIKALLEQPNIRKATGLRDRIFMLLMYDLAARCQEMLDLKVSDIEFRNTQATVFIQGKGSKARRLPISESVAMHVKNYIVKAHPEANPTEWLFYTISHGEKRPLSPDAVALFIKNYGRAARKQCSEVPERIHPHQLRHSRAMHLYRNGLNLVLLSEFMGHAHVDTTKIYAWSDTEMKRKALQKLPHIANQTEVKPIWENDEQLIRKLYGLA